MVSESLMPPEAEEEGSQINTTANTTAGVVTNSTAATTTTAGTNRQSFPMPGGLFPRTAPQRGGVIITPEKTEPPISPTTSNNYYDASISELKASISELKNAGVGGIGKATSTLVRNGHTGRFVICDVDDESFDDMMGKDMMHPAVIGEDIEEEEECEQDAQYLFKLPTHIIRGSILGDDVVDEAVRAATDGLSASSTSAATSVDDSLLLCSSPSVDDSLVCSSRGEGEDEEFFVVERRSSQDVDDKWRAFQQSSEDDAFELSNSWDNNNGDFDDNDSDSSFPSEPRWDTDEWTDWDNGESDKDSSNIMNFEVLSGKVKSDPDGTCQRPFNPYAQLVLQSLD
jgi:hypothetical protein